MRRFAALPIVLLVTVAVGACNGDDPTPTAQEPAAQSDTAPNDEDGGAKPKPKPKPEPRPDGTTIKLAGSQFGEIIFDGNDQAIYLFDKETGPASECYGDCAAAWPPVLTDGEPVAAGGVAQGKLGTTERDDGTTQVTYNDHPLYYYAHEGPGEVKCHNVPGFGGLWLVLDADGNAV